MASSLTSKKLMMIFLTLEHQRRKTSSAAKRRRPRKKKNPNRHSPSLSSSTRPRTELGRGEVLSTLPTTIRRTRAGLKRPTLVLEDQDSKTSRSQLACLSSEAEVITGKTGIVKKRLEKQVRRR